MKILLDGDGCVFDMLSAVQRIEPKFCPAKVMDYDLKLEGYGISRDRFFEIANHPSVLKYQSLYPGGREAVQNLLSLGHVVGWSGVSDLNKPGRALQFAILGVYDIDLDKSFHEDADVVIDDDVRQLLRFDKSVKKFLITRQYNQHLTLREDIVRVSNLQSVVDCLEGHMV